MDSVIKIENVSKKYGGLIAVKNVELELRRGEVLGMIGPNGAGKSTLFNLITNIERADGGQILVLGKNQKRRKPEQICHMGVGRTFQIVKPFGNLTVLQNVMVSTFSHQNDETNAKAYALKILEFVGLYDRRDTLGYDLPLPGLKRLELARALGTKPKILLLDEVMAGLNPGEINQMINLLVKINQNGCTLFVIEHVMRAIMALSERVVVLHLGQKIMEGTPMEVVSEPEVIKAYLGKEYVHS